MPFPMLQLRDRTTSPGFIGIVVMLKGSLDITAPGTHQTLVVRFLPARTATVLTDGADVGGHTAKATDKLLSECMIEITHLQLSQVTKTMRSDKVQSIRLDNSA